MKRSKPAQIEAQQLELRRLQTAVHLNSARILRAMERRIAVLFSENSIDLTPAQGNALVVLFEAKTPISAVQLADAMGVTQATVTRFVKALQAGDWLTRERSPDDARAMLLVLTPKAYEHLPTLIAVSNEMLDDAFAGLDPETVASLAQLTRRIRDNLS